MLSRRQLLRRSLYFALGLSLNKGVPALGQMMASPAQIRSGVKLTRYVDPLVISPVIRATAKPEALSILYREPPNRYVRLQQVKNQPGARAMIVSPQTPKAYLVTSKYGQNTTATSEELQFRPTPVPGTFSVIS